MDFTGCNIEKAVADETTKLSPVFDPRLSSIPDYIEVFITRSMNKLVLDYAEEASYRYPAWAFKALLEKGIFTFRHRKWDFYKQVIDSNSYFRELLDYRSRSSLLPRKLQVYGYQQRFISKDMNLGLEDHRFALVMFVGLISGKIPFATNSDYSVLTPNALIRRKATGLVAAHIADT